MNMRQKFRIDKNAIAYRIISGKGVILNLETSYYYTLNKSATQIWDLLNKGKDLEEILTYLKKEYPLPEEKLREDLMELIKDLKKEKLIT